MKITREKLFGMDKKRKYLVDEAINEVMELDDFRLRINYVKNHKKLKQCEKDFIYFHLGKLNTLMVFRNKMQSMNIPLLVSGGNDYV